MGFPLDRGSVEDGILTCHWHHARFDLASGCTFDLWADDVPTCPVEVRDGEVWIKPSFGHGDPSRHWRRGSTTAWPTTRARDRQGRAGTAHGRRAAGARSCGRRRCSPSRTATAGESARRSSPRSATCSPCCRKRRPISRCSTAPGGSPRTAMARRRDGSAPRSRAGPISRPSSAGCGTGAPCAIARPPNAPCSPPSPLAPRRPRLPPAVRGGDGPRLRRRRPLARLHQQGLRVPRPDRLGARRCRVAERGRADGGGARRRGDDGLAPPGGPCRLVRGSRRGVAATFSGLPAVPMAGRIMRSCPPPSSAMMRTRSWRRSRRRSGRGRPRPISAARWPMRRRCAWRVSAPRTSMPTGRRPSTSSPTPTPFTRR